MAAQCPRRPSVRSLTCLAGRAIIGSILTLKTRQKHIERLHPALNRLKKNRVPVILASKRPCCVGHSTRGSIVLIINHISQDINSWLYTSADF